MKLWYVHVAGGTLIVSSLALWYYTGAEGYTRWPNERLAQADAPPVAGENDLLAEAGFYDAASTPPRPDIQSRFAFGLVPGGVDPKHLVSVATVAGLSFAASGVALVVRHRRRSNSSTKAVTSPAGGRP